MSQLCPCKSTLQFDKCCKPIITGETDAKTAEQLMRSRYSAYATQVVDYLLDSSCSVNDSKDDIETFSKSAYFQHLEIVSTSENSVEFKAYFILEGKQQLLHEQSTFEQKENGSWCYKEGTIYPEEFSQGRNEKCICGSGKKFKQCCAKRM